jgi:hypothetical protein
MAEQVPTVINRQDPEIEAYRLGLLGDTQGLVRDQIFGRNVQNLRQQGLSNEDIAERLGREITDVEGITADQVFAPPDYETAKISANEQRAIDLASEGVGAYQPYLDRAGLGLEDASSLMGEAAGGLRGTGAEAMRQAQMGQAGLDASTAGSRGIAGAASGALASQALAGQEGLTGAAQFGQRGAGEAAQRARASTMAAQQALADAGRFGRGAAESGIGQLAGSTGAFDPSGIGSFMNQYEDSAVQQALADISEAGERRRSQIGADAAAAGAFGSRRQLREGMLDEEILDQQTRAATQMRQAGFESAAQRAQQAFEQQQGRRQAAAMGTGQLGQAGAGTSISAAGQGGQLGLSAEQLAQTGSLQGAQLGLSAAGQGAGLGMDAAKTGATLGLTAEEAAARGAIAGTGLGMDALRTRMAESQGIAGLGGQMAGVGMNYANLGQLGQSLSASDLDRLMTTGGLGRGINQAEIDALRMSNLQNYSQPYQQYGFLSDIYSGVPTGSSTMQVSSMPSANPFQTAVGLGIGAYGAASGAQRAGIF